jgi:hypothetical protein
VLIVSGIIGFRIGMIGFPDWQVAVETSQVVAGLVQYPDGNPFFIYHTKLWTILHQICAPLLLAGVSEIRLSLLISGLLGTVTFQALSMFIYAFSRDALLAIGAAVLIFVTRSAEYGAIYGVFLLGNENTYGILGLSFCVLAVSLIGAGWYRSGGFLLGLAPAVHPSLGAWTCAIAVCAFAWDFSRSRIDLRPALIWFSIGAVVTTASLIVQLAFIYHAPPVTGEFSTREIAAFITFWDGHRRPVGFNSTGVILNVAALALASIWLIAFASDLPRPSLFLLRVTIVSTLTSLALVFISWVPPEKLPILLLVLMPGRVLNYNAMTFVALVLALLGCYRQLFWNQILLLGLICGLVLGNHSMLWDWMQRHGVFYQSPVRPLLVVAATTIALVICTGWTKWHGWSAARSTSVVRMASVTLLVGAVLLTLAFSTPASQIFHDRTNDVFFGEVAAGRGLLLTAGDLHLIQLRTRRPVLLDGGGLDGLLYSLEGGPGMARILREVYGVDLLNPPEEARGAGRVPPEANRRVWEAYPPEKWQDIKRAFDVTQVLTYPDWTLRLPVAAHSRRFVLYQIP